MRVWIGIDETDSSEGGCTTYVAYRIALEFSDRLLSPPRLIRFNPNVPRKTRGNGGLALEIEADDIDALWDRVLEIVEAHRREGEDTGVVLVRDRKKLYEHYIRTVTDIVEDPPLGLAEKYSYWGSGRGLIGALAAIGFSGPHTYELLTYRIGKRYVDRKSVEAFDRLTRYTFANVSPHPIIVPHGNDPVLYGIRGTEPRELLDGLKIIRSSPYEGYALFITNQATDAHLIYRKIEDLKPRRPAYIEGRVSKRPKIIGSHVYLEVEDDTGSIEVFFYRQTGFLRRIALSLEVGDYIGILGGVREASEERDMTLNAEKLRVYKLVERIRERNPKCPVCGATLKSAGRGKGWKCKRCGRRGFLEKERIIERPKITKGVYVGMPDSRRHLLRPPYVIPSVEDRWKKVDRRPKRVR